MPEQSTISSEYLAMQRELHKNPRYGSASLKYAPIVKSLMQHHNIKSLSDYGAGKCNLHKALTEQGLNGYRYYPYDPAFPEYGPPLPADLVCCIDVLEHIEPGYLDAVLLDLKSITRSIGFFSICMRPAHKALSDGRNAHLIQKPSSWWLPKLCEHFEIVVLNRDDEGFWTVLEPREASRSFLSQSSGLSADQNSS